MPGFVSQPLGPVYVRMSRVAGDAFNTEMTQIRWDRQADGQWGEEAGRHSAESWGKLHTESPPAHAWSPRDLFYNIQVSGLSAKYRPIKTALLTKHLFYMYLQPMDRFTCVFKYEPVLIHQYSTCLFVQGCVHAWCARVVKLWVKIWVCVCVSVMNTHCTTWNIKRWRWRCPCAGIGWGCVMILSRAMSCGNGCLAHPLITSMFNPPPPPSPLFSHWANDLHAWDDFPSPIAGGECSLDVQQGPNSFKLLPLTNSDFRGFHSWVDTDVLVSAIMGPLSFHANWSERAELRGSQHWEKENL